MAAPAQHHLTGSGLPALGTRDLRVRTVRVDEGTTWLVFHGEADLATREVLTAELRAASRSTAPRSLHLHVADLGFADAHAVAELARFAAEARLRGADVLCCAPTPVLRRVAGLLGVERLLGLT
jgi:anti-anti-sigma regulatory factor